MTMLSPLYFFDVDDVAVGPNTAILSQKERRILIKNLSSAHINWLGQVSRDISFNIEDVPIGLYEKLQDQNVVRLVGTNSVRRSGRRMQLPSRLVRRLVGPLIPLTTFKAHCAIIFGVILLVQQKIIELVPIHATQEVIASMNLEFALAAVCTIPISSLAHELGHSAACLRVTKMTGSIRATTYRGIPALATDVSSVCLAGPKGRAAIAISGATTQIAFAAVLLLVDNSGVRFGATIAMLSAIFVVTPLPLTDGYWLLRDLTGLRLKPYLFFSGTDTRLSDVIYGWCLLAMTIFFAALLSYEGVQFAKQISFAAGESLFRAALFTMGVVYLSMVVGVFVIKNIKLFFER
jgi:hypothetical protein